MSRNKARIISRYTWVGIVFGFFFPVFAITLLLVTEGLPFTFRSVVALHQQQLALWVVDLAPLVLGLCGYWIGTIYATLQLGHQVQLSTEIDNNKLILEGCLDGVVTFTTGGKILFRNAAFTAMFAEGFQPADFLSVSIFKPMAAGNSNGDEADHYFLQGFEGLYRMVTKGMDTFKMKTSAEGSVLVSISMSKTRIKGNSLYTAFVRDVSEQHELELERDRLFDQTNDLVCIATPDGYFRRINPAFSHTLGFTDTELMAHKYLHFIHPDDRAGSVADAEALMKSPGTVLYTENRYVTRSGRYVWLAWNTIWDPPTQKIFGIARDITEKLEAERLLEKNIQELQKANKELDQFAYVVSHDLKAPLRAINSLADWIAEDMQAVADDETKDNLKLLRNRVSRMNDLIDGILSYSRAGKKKGQLAKVPLADIVRDALDNINIPDQINVTVPLDMPVVKCDRTMLLQVLMNLITNAIKYHDKPQGKVWLEASSHTTGYAFAVGDDGPGIDEIYHEKIFDMFQTLEARDVKESTGIGLAIVKKLVEELKGTITLQSAVGQGSVFKVTLPKQT